MPRYFFHLRNGRHVLLDPDGQDLADDAAAAERALSEARFLISQDVLTGVIDLAQRVDVEDPEGRIIHSLAFTDAIDIWGG